MAREPVGKTGRLHDQHFVETSSVYENSYATGQLTNARTELAEQLAQQRQRAETAERHAIRSAAQLCTELTTTRGQLEHWQAQAAEHQATLAGVHSELTAAAQDRERPRSSTTGRPSKPTTRN